MNRILFKYSKTIGLALAATATIQSISPADTIILKNGSRIEGSATRTVTGWTVTSDSGVSTELPSDSVASIEVGPHPKATTSTTEPTVGSRSAVTAESNLASLRRSVESATSTATVIERYRRFIDQSAGTTASTEAKADLAMWQDRQSRGLVKVGTEWVTPEEKAAMAAHAGEIAAEAAALLDQGRVQEAEPVLQSALDADAQNPAGLYLRGLMLFNKEQIVASRKAFESLLAVAPDSGPGYNNLAVILWKQNQLIPALQAYDRSITASPLYKAILDNVAEALAAVPNEQRKNAIAIKLLKKFSDQDAQLQAILAPHNQYRWGATWVDQKTLEKLKDVEKSIKENIDRITADAGTAQARMAEIDKLTANNNSTMAQLQGTAYARDAEGRTLQLPLPPAFYTLQNENERMAQERASLQTKLQSLSDEAHRAQQSMPVPRFTGIQHVIGVDGMPGRTTTRPTTEQTLGVTTGTLGGPTTRDVSISIGPANPISTTEASTMPSTQPNIPVLIPLP